MKKIAQFFGILALIFTLGFIAPSSAMAAGNAADDNAATCVFCKVSLAISGGTGRALAVLIIISMGVMLFFGKVTWGLAAAVFIGMAFLFGAEGAVRTFTGTGVDCAQFADIDCGDAGNAGGNAP